MKKAGKPQVKEEAKTRVRLEEHVPGAQNLKNAKKLSNKHQRYFKAMS